MKANTTNYSFFGNLNISDSSADMAGISKQDLETNAILAEEALTVIRNDLRAQGYEVEAFNRKNNIRVIPENNSINNDSNIGGSSLPIEAHPNLPFMGGKADQLFIPGAEDDPNIYNYLSETQKDAIAKKKQRMANQLKNKLKHGMKQAFKFVSSPKNVPKNVPVVKYKTKFRPTPL